LRFQPDSKSRKAIGCQEFYRTYQVGYPVRNFIVPIRLDTQSGDEGEMIIGVSPTALGRSVRSELKGVLKKIQDEENATAFLLIQ